MVDETQTLDEGSLLAYMRDRAYRPLTIEELEVVFAVDEEDHTTLHRLLSEMEQKGMVVLTRTHRYGLPERMDLVVGRLQVKTRGFGFIVPIDHDQTDVYVGAGDLGGAMDGDKVMARLHRDLSGTRREAEIIRVLERAHDQLVGVLTTHGTYGFVQPDDKRLNQDIWIPGDSLNGAVDGQKVVIDITSFASNGVQSASGRVVEILGFPQDPGVDILSIVRKYGLPESFEPEVLEAAEQIPEQVSETEIGRRRDLRDRVIVTIDGADAKDLDDAVHVRRLENGHYELGVHIADVSYYVREGSPLDREAYRRGTSVYLVDRVIPMLPPRLSNGLCSLNPQVDRLTLTCEMEWSQDFTLIRHDIYPSVIRTTERMTYDNVRAILTQSNDEVLQRYHDLLPQFALMQALALGLRARRMTRGAVDFDFAETKIRVNEWGKPTALVQRERSIAEMIIEEFMLAANETVAEHFFWMEIPFLYRVHEPPTVEKMTALNEFVHFFGHHLKAATKVHPRALQDLLTKVRGQPEEMVISHVMLRSLKQARYSQEALGHFGLAAAYYSHFTSPIRRYPDLMIHRIMREILVDGGLTAKRQDNLTARMPEIASQCSERERNAVDAERETDLIKKIEFMMDKVGEEFEGMISGVTGFGLFVALDNSAEGLIHVSYLDDDYYHYHEHLHALIGERLGRTFRIGDRVRVRMLAASKEKLSIDFALIEAMSRIPGAVPSASATAKGKRTSAAAHQDHKEHHGRKKKSVQDRQMKKRGAGSKMEQDQGMSMGIGDKPKVQHRKSSTARPNHSGKSRAPRSESGSTTGKGSLLPSKGGYQGATLDVARNDPGRQRKDRAAMRQVTEVYGVQVKDKGFKQ